MTHSGTVPSVGSIRSVLPSVWTVGAVGIALLLALPLVVVFSSLATPTGAVWRHLWQTQLPELLFNTLRLLAGVGLGTLVVGTGLAWLVVHYHFPGRRFFEWALILPLAMPAYVIGFVFLGLFEFTGPVQTFLRQTMGMRAPLPDLRSYWGVTLMMILVFYPYVYFLARTAFREQGTAMLETARSLGRSRWGAFLTVMIPITRPSLAAGVALAMMEAMADFGTVATFGYRTLTEAIYRVWYGMFDRSAATQLASGLLVFAFVLLYLERRSRGRARFTQVLRHRPNVVPVRLHGWRAYGATGVCLLILGPGFLLPVAQLVVWAVTTVTTGNWAQDFSALLLHTMYLAALAAGVTCLFALWLAYAGRLHPVASVRITSQAVAMGYALPGSVIAVGVLHTLSWLDHTFVPQLPSVLGVTSDLLLTGSAVGLVFAYVIRFMAISLQTVEASLSKVPTTLDDAARVLGAGASRTLGWVHLPLIRSGLLTAIILVFVETMKEMPATLLLRPFGLNTLAVEVWQRTSEAMWQEAAVPALAIVSAGIVPVLLAVRLSTRTSQS